MASRAVHVLAREAETEIDPRALGIPQAYFKCYDFQSEIPPAQEKLQRSNSQAHIPWPTKALSEIHGKLTGRRLGIPQGGALSGLIVNAMLHSADKRLESEFGGDVTYVRYCDDMLVLARSGATCERAFERYLESMKELRFPVHPPVAPSCYGRQHWATKSRLPYRWGPLKDQGEIPWIQFVGYQIRYDGLLRIRPATIAKHRARIIAVVDKALSIVPILIKKAHVTAADFALSVEWRLVAMAIGRRRRSKRIVGPFPWSWLGAFVMLGEYRLLATQLKDLDRLRGAQFRRLRRVQFPTFGELAGE